MKNILFLALSTALLLISDKLAAQLPARSAYEFVESVGVCTHFDYTNTKYVQQFDSVKSLLHDIGVRYVRDRAGVHTDHGSQRCLELYNEYGIKNVAVFNARNSDRSLNTSTINGMVSRAAAAPNMFAAFEGPNEYDNNHPDSDTAWAASLYAFQQLLYDKIKNHPNTLVANTPVLGPSTTFYQGVASMGDFSDVCDYYNIHAYPGAVGPSTPLDNYLVEVPKYNGDIEIYATETGYHTALERGPRPHYPINEASEAKYLPRLFMHYFQQGILKTFSYEFLNLQDNPTNDNMQYNFGLVRYNLSKKPAYYAVKNMLTLLNDEPSESTLPSFDFALSGDTVNLKHQLFQKSDGRYYLALWREVSVWDRNLQTEISNPDAAVTLTFNQPVEQSKVYLPYNERDYTAALRPVATEDNPSSVDLSVPDHLMMVEIVPGLPTQASASAPYASSPVVVDGVLDEYTLGSSFTRTVAGSSDNQVAFATQWDFTYLYVGIRVMDADLQNESPNAWQDDAVELFLDPTLNRGTTYDSLDRQLLLGWGDSTLKVLPQALVGVQHAQTNLEDGYSMEVAIPWVALGVPPSAGHMLGFDVGVDDDDDGAGREAQLMWAGSGKNFRNPSGFGRLVLAKPDTVHYTSAQRDIPSRMGSGNWFKGRIPDGYLDANQRSGAEGFRSSLFEQDYWNGTPVLQLDAQLVFAYQNGLQPPVVQFSVREGRPYPTTYEDWYAIGQQYAERYSPNSDWFVSQGIADYGVVWWGLGNEPDRGVRATPDSLDDVSPEIYAEMYRGYAEGIESVDPEALVLVHGIRATGWDNPWLEAVAPLLNDGTLDALDIHKYVDIAQIKSGTWSMQYRFDLLKKQTGVSRPDVLFTCTEFNTKEQQSNEDDAARSFLFTVWDAWGVVDGNANPNTVFAFPWTIYFSSDTTGTMAASNTPRWAMAEQLDPWIPNQRGQTLQLVTELADGTSVIYSDPYEAGELKLTGENKTIWVWNNWQNATNSYGSSYTVKDIPADATTLEVWGYDGQWNGVRQTINVSGKTSHTVNGLEQDQTYMFVLNGNTTNEEAFQGTYQLLARHSGKALAVNLNEQTNGGFSDATANGVNVFQYGTDNQNNRLWDIQPVGDGYYQLISVYSGKALAIDTNPATNGGHSEATVNGVNVFQYGTSEDEDDNRLWKIEEADEGYHVLINRQSGRALDVYQASKVDGANVQQWGTGSQNPIHRQWQLVAVNDNAREAAVSNPKAEGLLTPGSEVRLYPNPASERLTVEAVGQEDYQVMMYDLTGRLMLQRNHLKGVSQLDISHLRPGVYLLKLRDSEQHELRRRVLVE